MGGLFDDLAAAGRAVESGRRRARSGARPNGRPCCRDLSPPPSTVATAPSLPSNRWNRRPWRRRCCAGTWTCPGPGTADGSPRRPGWPAGRGPGAAPAGDRGVRAARPVHRPGRRGGILRPAAADPHPRLHQPAQAARGRAGHGAGLHAVPAALAARHPGTRREGSRGVLAVVEQLQGFELAAGAWEKAVLPARVTGYRREWLDEVCLDGGVAWGRLSVRGDADELPSRGGGAVPGHADHPDHPGRPAVAAAGGPRRAPARGTRARAAPRRARRAAAARRAVPARPGVADRAAAVRGRGGAVGRRRPRPGHGGRVPRRPVAVRPPRDAERSRPAPAPPRQPAQLADGRPVVAAARARRRTATRTTWPRRSPSSWPRAGAWCSATCWPGRTSPCHGGRCCGRSAGWRPAARSAAAGSSTGSAASSSPTRTR